jgi:outer membrane protein assembly factor BamB
MKRWIFNAFIALELMISTGIPSLAEDWPHWMGPRRDNTWNEESILESFPAEGPKILWRQAIAGGYAGPAVAGGQVFVTDYVTSENVKVPNFERQEFTGIERVICLDEVSGKIVWKHEYPVKYSISYPAGPRCTPVVDGDLVYTLGAEGHLWCFQAANGKVVWSKNLPQEYQTKAALWGYAAHPLVDGDRIITLAGGKGSHVVAFDKRTGKEIWRTLTSPEQGYSPPTIIVAAGVRQLILLRPDAVSSINPDSGKLLWTLPYEATSGSIIMSPVHVGDYLYAAGYSDKSLLVKMNADGTDAEEIWRDKRKDAISPVNVQPFLDRATGILYGFDQSGDFVALKLPEGKRLWATPQPLGDRPVGSGTAFLVKQAERFWLFTERGELVIARLSPEGFTELDRAKVIEPTNVAFGRDVVWSMPAYANRHAYIRNDQEIIAVDLSAGS